MKDNFIVQAWLVILLGIIFGAGLAGVQLALSEKIEQNKLAETLAQIPSLVPGAEAGKPEDKIFVEGKPVFKAMADGQQVGWVIPANGQGFADVIELLIGVNAEVTQITGLYIIGQKETPGLGNKITENIWLDQFKLKDTLAPLMVVKREAKSGANEIRAVTGATISSESVCNIVNKAMNEMRGKLTS